MIEKLQLMALMFVNDLKTERDERGATAVEYGLMVSLIAVAIIATVRTLGTTLDGLFATVTGALWANRSRAGAAPRCGTGPRHFIHRRAASSTSAAPPPVAVALRSDV